MTITVHLFAAAKDLAGAGTVQVSLDVGATVADLRLALAKQARALAELLERCMIAVNQEFVENAQSLIESDEVAVIPPVSGGTDSAIISGLEEM